MTFNELAQKINETSTAHGFWPGYGRNFGEMIALAHSELSEALEEHRAGHPVHYHQIKVDINTVVTPDTAGILAKMRDNSESIRLNGEPIHDINGDEVALLVRHGIAKPEGAAVELADCVIRCLDTLYSIHLDIDSLFRQHYKLGQLEGINSLSAYNKLIKMGLAENFGENLSEIHTKLSVAYTARKDGHDSAMFALVVAIALTLRLMESLDVDVDAVIAEKMTYNESRPHKHGKAY